MIQRFLERNVCEALDIARVVHLTGIRQCGKTTLVESAEIPQKVVRSLDDAMQLRIASDDPMGFVKRGMSRTMVIDEIQKEPKLLNAIKHVVDHDADHGQYLITGSANLSLIAKVGESLAGRKITCRLRTLSQAELDGRAPDFLKRAFSGDLHLDVPAADKHEIIRRAILGGFPGVLTLDAQNARYRLLNEYIDDILKKDVKDVCEIRKLPVLRRLVREMMARSSKFANTDEFATGLCVSKVTIGNYLAALEAVYLFDMVPAFSDSDYGLVSRPKYFAADTSLISATFGYDADEVYLNDDRCGKLVETWVYQQLASMADISSDVEIYHYRDTGKREIDFILTHRNGDMVAIEVKSGSIASKSDFRHIVHFRDKVSKGRLKAGIVLYSGQMAVEMGDRLWAVPLAAL